MKIADNNINAIDTFHDTTFVGKSHPIGLACLRSSTLSQLADFSHRWDYKSHSFIKID